MKPAASGGAYDMALQWLRNGSDALWDPQLGYDRIGKPSTLGLPRGCATCKRYKSTRFVRHDKWDWGISSAADQGLLFYVLHARLRAYAVAPLGANLTVRHYQGAPKPWETSDRPTTLLQWHWYKDLTAEALGGLKTRCARLLSARREYVHTYFHANASGAEGERPRLRLRPYRSQPVL